MILMRLCLREIKALFVGRVITMIAVSFKWHARTKNIEKSASII